MTKNLNLNIFTNTLSYICLLACGLYISKDAFYQYKEGKTAFQTVQGPLTLDDLPFITICYYYKKHNTLYNLDYYTALAMRSYDSVEEEDWKLRYSVSLHLTEELTGQKTWIGDGEIGHR